MDSLTILFILNGVFFISLFLLKNIFISLALMTLSLFIIFFFLRQKKIATTKSLIKIPSFDFKDSQYVASIICLIVFLILQVLIGFNAALFITFFIFSYINKLRSRISFIIALVLFILMALLTSLSNYKMAEDIAILTYYFLVIGVVWQIIELRNIIPSEGINQEPVEEVFQRRSFSYNYIFPKRAAIMITLIIFFGLIIVLFVKQIKPTVIKKAVVKQQIATPIITPIPKKFIHASLIILNATDIRGLAGSSAAILRRDGWQKEFDISTGNYLGNDTLSANILKYTKNLEGKVALLEHSLNIKVTPILLKQATQEAEFTLILGK